MQDLLKVRVRRFASGWWLWALVLLALPNCTLDRSGIVLPSNVTTGDLPHSSAIMCDIERFQGPARRCATAEDLATGIPLAMAAEALVSGQSSNVGLDFSAAAQAVCGMGNPQAIDFYGSFPEGSVVCLNCGVIPTAHADAAAVCVAKCQDLVRFGDPEPADHLAYCMANARPSTLFPVSGCFDNACSEGGTLRSDFADPRRIPEPVVWRDIILASAVGSNLTQTGPTTTGLMFAAGAVSEQWVPSDDAYAEFEAAENDLSHMVGFAQVPAACPFPCTDTVPGLEDIHYGLLLQYDGRVYVFEAGVFVPGPDLSMSFGTYVAGERFRVRVKDHFDGTATVSYTRVVGTCVPGNPCSENLIFAHSTPSAVYPLRVAAAFREQNATLANVNIVRIP
jgi:hypothetical protein